MNKKILFSRIKDYLQRLKFMGLYLWGPSLLAHKGVPKMVVIMVDGGFASVLLKYAMGLWFEKKWNWHVKYDLGWFERCGVDMDGLCSRKFQFKEVFPWISYDVASPEEAFLYRKWFRHKNRSLFRYEQSEFFTPRPIYLDGYYANWRYLALVQDDFVKRLRLDAIKLDIPNTLKLATIREKEISVAIHVRRGDYVRLGLGFITADYYISAIEYIRKAVQERKISLFIFSNGFDWVEKELIPRLEDEWEKVDINDNDSGYLDLYLMSQCQHQIICNSWLGFFAAFVNQNPNRITVVPDKINNENVTATDAYGMPGWVRLSSETGGFIGIHDK